MAASGGRIGRAVERLLGGLGRDRLVAGLAQDDAQRPQDLRLVVDHEDARHAGASTGAGSGSSTTKDVPCPGSDSTRTRPPLASTRPRTMASPRPDPLPSAPRAAVERREDPLLLGERDARPVVAPRA